MVEASHEKENRAKETIQQLKLEISNLSRLVEQGMRVAPDSAPHSAAAAGMSAVRTLAAARPLLPSERRPQAGRLRDRCGAHTGAGEHCE